MSGSKSIAWLAAVLLWCGAAASQAGVEYAFDAPRFLAPANALPGWAATLERHHQQRATIYACLEDSQRCDRRLRSLAHVLAKGADLKRTKQLRLVNHYVNKRKYRRDRNALGPSVAEAGTRKLRNHWATLLEFLNRGGDCEDYAAAKYFILREWGVPAEDMRIVVAWERRERSHHAVLAVRKLDETVLLESDNSIRRGTWQYRFIYAVNEEGIWDHEYETLGRRAESSNEDGSVSTQGSYGSAAAVAHRAPAITNDNTLEEGI